MGMAIHTWHTARKSHVCEGEAYGKCLREIQPGTRYLRSSLPPHADPCNADTWLTMSLCGPCAEYFRDTPADPLAA